MWMLAFAAVSAISNFMGQKAQQKAQQTIDRANVYAQKTTAEANNTLSVAQTALSNFNREMSNKKLMEKAGENYNAIGTNIGRARDNLARGSLQQRLQSAEYLGAIASQASFNGVSGSTINAISDTVRRNMSVQEQYQKDNANLEINQMKKERYSQISNAIAGSDLGSTFAQFQSTNYHAPYRAGPTLLSFAGDFLSAYSSVGGLQKPGAGIDRFGGGKI